MTTVTLTRDQVTEDLLGEALRFSGELSDLGLRGFPERFVIPGVGNGNAFIRSKIERDNDNDICSITYKQQFGCAFLTIFND